MNNQSLPLLLIADDDAGIRSLMHESLSRKGCQTLMAQDGLQAVDLFQTHLAKIDLVIVNAVMPNLNGCHASRLMRSLRAQTPIILMSGYSKEALAQENDLSAISDFLHKPFKLDDAYQLVQCLLAAGPTMPLN